MSWYEKSDITDSKVDDVILSYDLNREIIVEAKLVGEVDELVSDDAHKFKLILENRKIELTVYHLFHTGEMENLLRIIVEQFKLEMNYFVLIQKN